MKAYMNQYQSNQVATATPEQILVMLYDGAIRFVRQARDGMAAGDRVTKLKMIDKTMAILNELSATLDHEIGGEIAANLAALYDFMNRELVRSNLKNDPQPLDIVERILSELREAWVQAIEINRQASARTGSIPTTAAGEPRPFSVAL